MLPSIIANRNGNEKIMEIVKIYLCGGMGGLSIEEQMKWRNQIRDEIKFNNSDTRRIPSFISPPNYYSTSMVRHKTEREIFEYELNHIRKADLIVVNFNAPKSISTAMELMVAKEHNIPIIGINADGHELHPWLELCTTRMCDSIRETVNHVVNFYLN